MKFSFRGILLYQYPFENTYFDMFVYWYSCLLGNNLCQLFSILAVMDNLDHINYQKFPAKQGGGGGWLVGMFDDARGFG